MVISQELVPGVLRADQSLPSRFGARVEYVMDLLGPGPRAQVALKPEPVSEVTCIKGNIWHFSCECPIGVDSKCSQLKH